MENRYRIKEEYKKLFKPNWGDRVFERENGIYLTVDNSGHKQYFGRMTGSMFEKVEDEIKPISLCFGHSHGAPLHDLLRVSCVITKEKLQLCEKALNGELIEKRIIIQWLKQHCDGDAFIERLNMLLGYPLSDNELENYRTLNHPLNPVEKTKIATCTPEEMDEVMGGKQFESGESMIDGSMTWPKEMEYPESSALTNTHTTFIKIESSEPIRISGVDNEEKMYEKQLEKRGVIG